jgi:hypothetical protein
VRNRQGKRGRMEADSSSGCFPQGLKPKFHRACNGTAKAVPLRNNHLRGRVARAYLLTRA